MLALRGNLNAIANLTNKLLFKTKTNTINNSKLSTLSLRRSFASEAIYSLLSLQDLYSSFLSLRGTLCRSNLKRATKKFKPFLFNFSILLNSLFKSNSLRQEVGTLKLQAVFSHSLLKQLILWKTPREFFCNKEFYSKTLKDSIRGFFSPFMNPLLDSLKKENQKRIKRIT